MQAEDVADEMRQQLADLDKEIAAIREEQSGLAGWIVRHGLTDAARAEAARLASAIRAAEAERAIVAERLRTWSRT